MQHIISHTHAHTIDTCKRAEKLEREMIRWEASDKSQIFEGFVYRSIRMCFANIILLRAVCIDS